MRTHTREKLAYGYLNLACFIEKVSNSLRWDCCTTGRAACTLQRYRVYSDALCQRAMQQWVFGSTQYCKTYQFLPHCFSDLLLWLKEKEGEKSIVPIVWSGGLGYADFPDRAVSLANASASKQKQRIGASFRLSVQVKQELCSATSPAALL